MRRIDQLVSRDTGEIAHAPPMSRQQWGGDVKSARMECAREIAQRLRRIAAAVQQQDRRRVRPVEHEPFAADDDSVGTKHPSRHREPRQVVHVLRAPHERRDSRDAYDSQEHFTMSTFETASLLAGGSSAANAPSFGPKIYTPLRRPDGRVQSSRSNVQARALSPRPPAGESPSRIPTSAVHEKRGETNSVVPLRSTAFPSPVSRASTSETDSRVAPTSSHSNR